MLINFFFSKFEEALCAMEDGTKKYRHTFLSVGRAYIDDLLRLKDYKKAGEICKRVLGECLHKIL